MAESDSFASYLENINIITDESLAEFWPEVLRRAAATATQDQAPPVPELAAPVNLARGKAATQSSRSQWSRGETLADDAAGAVDGAPDGERKLHTGMQTNPWWQVDLGQPMVIGKIVITNTTHPVARARFTRFSLSIGFDADSLVEVFRKKDDAPVGGVDGEPFIWQPTLSAYARLVRVTLIGTAFLHLAQVEVFGPS